MEQSYRVPINRPAIVSNLKNKSETQKPISIHYSGNCKQLINNWYMAPQNHTTLQSKATMIAIGEDMAVIFLQVIHRLHFTGTQLGYSPTGMLLMVVEFRESKGCTKDMQVIVKYRYTNFDK